MKVLVVGDPHATVGELGDMDGLRDRILDVKFHDPDLHHLLVLGDEHDGHALTRVEVTDWWADATKRFVAAGLEPWYIVGNHDRSHDLGNNANTIWPYGALGATIVSERRELAPGVFVHPWYSTEAAFRNALAQDFYAAEQGWVPARAGPHGGLVVRSGPPRTTIFCHQSFDGAKFDNGFWDPHGFKFEDLDVDIISGHVHSPQEFGRVWYPGSPRWRTKSDASVDRGIWTVDLVDGKVKSRQFFSTRGWCRQRVEVEFDQSWGWDGKPLAAETPPYDLRVLIRGDAEFEGKVRAALPSDAQVQVVRPGVVTGKVKESDGIDLALGRYLDGWKPLYGTDPAVFRAAASERLHV